MLLRANLTLLTMAVIHSLDHAFNQPDSQSGSIIGPGALGMLVLVLAIGLTLAHRPEAAPLTAAIGFGHAIGFALLHVVPGTKGSYFTASDINALSWLVLIASLGVSLWAGWVGLFAWRAQSAATGRA